MIEAKWIVSLQGKQYPTWPGVLDAAHREGLLSLETDLVQIPTAENGYVAIVAATATFPGPDGRERIFRDVGDASPANTNSRIATALIRMASTRAKGRALRDAINVGQTMLEELPEEEAHNRPPVRHEGKADTYRQERAARTTDSPGDAAASGYVTLAPKCADCGEPVPANVAAASEKRFGRVLCIADGKARATVEKNAAEAKP